MFRVVLVLAFTIIPALISARELIMRIDTSGEQASVEAVLADGEIVDAITHSMELPVGLHFAGVPECFENREVTDRAGVDFTIGTNPATGQAYLDAFVISTAHNVFPDTWLYRCGLSADGPILPGDYMITCSNLQMGARGQTVDSQCVNGVVTVLGCPADCNRDGMVTVEELLLAVRLSLEGLQPGQCDAADHNTDSIVTIDELIHGVNTALQGCDRL
jgi:hypothetical protein